MKLYLDSANPNDWTLPAGVPAIAQFNADVS